MFYEPRPGATRKEILADPRNWILILVLGIGGGIGAYLLLFLFCWLVFVFAGQDIRYLFQVDLPI